MLLYQWSPYYKKYRAMLKAMGVARFLQLANDGSLDEGVAIIAVLKLNDKIIAKAYRALPMNQMTIGYMFKSQPLLPFSIVSRSNILQASNPKADIALFAKKWTEIEVADFIQQVKAYYRYRDIKKLFDYDYIEPMDYLVKGDSILLAGNAWSLTESEQNTVRPVDQPTISIWAKKLTDDRFLVYARSIHNLIGMALGLTDSLSAWQVPEGIDEINLVQIQPWMLNGLSDASTHEVACLYPSDRILLAQKGWTHRVSCE